MNDETIKDEDEIELADIFITIWKQKYLIICLTAIITISAIVYLFFETDVYQSYMIIKPLKVNNEDYVDAPGNIKDLIDSDILKKQIIDELELTREDESNGRLSFNTSIIKKTDKIKISYNCFDPAYGVKVLLILSKVLDQHYAPRIKELLIPKKMELSQIDLQIDNLKHILQIELEIKNQHLNSIPKEQLYLENKQKNTEKEIQVIKERLENINNKRKITEKQYKDLFREFEIGNGKKPTTIEWYNTIAIFGSRLERFQETEHTLNMLLLKKQDELFDIFKKGVDINNVKKTVTRKYLMEQYKILLGINKFENQKRMIEDSILIIREDAIQSIRSPLSTAKPVKPKRKLIIMLSLVSGFFFSLFTAFLVEYFSNYMKKNKLQIR